MFKNKLRSLGYMEWDKVNANDPQHFRKVIVWLEDKKIRHYKIDERKKLRDISSESWPKTFQEYCKDVKCPVTGPALDQFEWFLGYGIWLEYEDNCKCKVLKHVTGKKLKNKTKVIVPNLKSKNPLDNLDFSSNEFRDGVNSLAKVLKIPKHSNHLVLLQACSKLICKRLNPEVVANPKAAIVKGKPFPMKEVSSGFIVKDENFDNALKTLTLLYIQDLRKLQTKINETIVAIQGFTANPKTDTKLGVVGRGM